MKNCDREIHRRNPFLTNGPLPVEVVFHPSWWHRHAGISFDEDFFYHPSRRVEAERRMEQVLYDRFGDLGLGEDRDRDFPVIGPVHNAAGYLLSEMLGCRVEYKEDAPPQVVPANRPDLEIDIEGAFASAAFLRFRGLVEALKKRFGYVSGDVNWGGVLNLALDLRGQDFFLDLGDRPGKVAVFLDRIARSIDRFTTFVQRETGSTSISVNRTVRHLRGSVFLHSECALTMISTRPYEDFLMPIDADWSGRRRPFGIHYCGADPHRFADVFARIPRLDFLDLGWGGEVGALRRRLPETFLNIRLSPVEIVHQSAGEIRQAVIDRVTDSGNPWLTGVCCINMDDRVTDDKVQAIFETVFERRKASPLSD
ncbi:MAG: hypothetical protein A2W03_09585 [Candidatus Aminicenantes bacterium RBG_16_63_16]|nr:MAG: hypothetical protein A2W03_09585 [Candidatus Aminicenantes bacterium RBG_16_63_16]